jgi:hypothetical protein
MSDAAENKLLPPPPPKNVRESLAAYFELLELGDAFVRARLRQQLGSQADIDTAYRQWNRQRIEHAALEKIRYLQESLRARNWQ